MKNVFEISVENLTWLRTRKKRFSSALRILSLLVVINVFWVMKQPGLTLVGDASCGYIEHRHNEDCNTVELLCKNDESSHIHTEDCYEEILTCDKEEHYHTISCYSDITADVETMLDWQEMFEDFPYTGNLRDDLIGIAKTQVGYHESEKNFEVGRDGVRRGYTRYGAWYGTPYRDWSAMFVSYCLSFAGADPDENPGNTGATAMAKQWDKRGNYTEDENYSVVCGDLVFFKDNTVGIISEVNSTTFFAIRGDADGEVREDLFTFADGNIKGWGIILETDDGIKQKTDQKNESTDPSETEQDNHPMTPSNAEKEDGIKNEPPLTPSEILELEELEKELLASDSNADYDLIDDINPSAGNEFDEDDILDITYGPAFIIYEGEQSIGKSQSYSLWTTRNINDLIKYLNDNDGSYFFTLLNTKNEELPKDDDGNYIVQPNTKYKLTISFVSPEGFHPGTYQYQVPNGLMVEGGEGEFILKDGTNVGSWTVTDTGLITLVFNENMNDRTNITISSALGINFPEQDEPIDFDGKITVSVEKPPPQSNPTYINKWGNQGGTEGSNGDDSSKIYWGVEIIGNKDSNIPNNILTDKIIDGEWSKDHKFTQSDIDAGLTIGLSENGNWHNWVVTTDDPHLIWTETGWSYKMPEKAVCQWCGEIELGNEGYIYYIHYTSTPDVIGVAGTYGYENETMIDGAYGYAWINFTQGDATGEIEKNGSFVSDAGGGAFRWEFQATIPARKEGMQADYHWYIQDNMKLLDSNGQAIAFLENDAHLAKVTATYNGITIEVPRIQDATDEDFFAWDNAWNATENGINYGREFNIINRCQCTEESCHWESGCGEYWYIEDDGSEAKADFCQCWLSTDMVTFTFVYETNAVSIVDNYGGLGYQVLNRAELYYIPEGITGGALVSVSDAFVPIPGLFKKELTTEFDGYTANYNVTVNEAKVALTDGSPLFIHDVMTNTLAYISGSLVITSEDANGNQTTLKQDIDYTVKYDGTGNIKDEAGKEVHVLDIVILHPQPVMYILDYDATLIIPEQITEGIKYGNSASITLWGESITDSSVDKVYADFNIAAKSYKILVYKTAEESGNPLEGAKFGLYNQEGGLIITGITNENGELLFQTDIVNGIVLREHLLYYLQELKAPHGYQLNDTKYWFCFCGETTESCKECTKLMQGMDITRFPFEQKGEIQVTNQRMYYSLPGTGGPGVYPFVIMSVIFIITPLIYRLSLKRKRERRE